MPTPRQHTDNAARQRAFRERQKQARTAEQQAKGLPPTPTITTMPGTARWNAMLTSAWELLNSTQAEMSAYFDNRTEQWQESERGDEFQRRLETLQEIAEQLGDLR